MKIIVIGSLAKSLVNFRGELLKAFVKNGHGVVACAPSMSNDVREQLTSFGIRCREVEISRTGLNPLADLKTLWLLIRLFREEKPDRILAYTIKPVLYGSLAARMAGVKGMYSMITGLGYAFAEQPDLRHRFVSMVVHRLYVQAMKGNCGIFFQNPDDLKVFQDRKLIPAQTKIEILNGSGVDLQHYAPAPLPETPSFLLIARLIVDKGIREYVEAARMVRKEYPAAVFFLAGWLDTNPSAITKEELEDWQNEGIVEYLGGLEDVRPALANCRVYVLPSYREGTPRSVLEAMSMGRPIITTDAPGCRETVISGENGFLVPVRDSAELAKAMMRFIADPELAERAGGESRRIAVEKYDVHRVNDKIIKVMEL